MESLLGPGRESNEELRYTINSTTTGSSHTNPVPTTNQPSHVPRHPRWPTRAQGWSASATAARWESRERRREDRGRVGPRGRGRKDGSGKQGSKTGERESQMIRSRSRDLQNPADISRAFVSHHRGRHAHTRNLPSHLTLPPHPPTLTPTGAQACTLHRSSGASACLHGHSPTPPRLALHPRPQR